MTTAEKVLLGAVAGAGVYFLLRPSADAAPILDPRRGEGNVMEHHGAMWTWGCLNDVEPALIASVIYRESAGNVNAAGAKGEIGLMQIKPNTARMFMPLITNVDLALPVHNISAGTQYLRYCLDKFDGNVAAALCAYNGGPSRVTVDYNKDGIISAPTAAKEYSKAVMARVPRFRAQFKAMPQYMNEYGRLFRPTKWFLNMESFSGLGMLPGRGYWYNVAQYDAGRRLPGECPTPPRGLGLRQGSRWLYQPGGLGMLPGRGYQYNVAQYAAGRRLPGECPTPPRGLGLRQGSRWLYQPRGF